MDAGKTFHATKLLKKNKEGTGYDEGKNLYQRLRNFDLLWTHIFTECIILK